MEDKGSRKLMSDTMRLIIADGNEAVRSSLAGLLAQLGGVEVVGQAASRSELSHLLARQQAEIVLLDYGLAGAETGCLIRSLRAAGCKVLLLSLDQGGDAHRLSREAGANSLLAKASGVEGLLRALHELGC